MPRRLHATLYVDRIEKKGIGLKPRIMYITKEENASIKNSEARTTMHAGPAQRPRDRLLLSKYLKKYGYRLKKSGIIVTNNGARVLRHADLKSKNGRLEKHNELKKVQKLLKSWEEIYKPLPRPKKLKN